MVTKNSIDSNIPIEIAKGGTNATTMSTSNGLVKYDGTSLVTSSTATLDASNRYLNTAQPSFRAYPSGNQNNVTGDGTTYFIAYGTEVFDQGNNYNTANGTFTAPVAGVYFFNFQIYLSGLTSSHTSGALDLVVNGGGNCQNNLNFATMRTEVNHLVINYCNIIKLAANDAVTTAVNVGNGTKVVSIIADANLTNFSGYLIC